MVAHKSSTRTRGLNLQALSGKNFVISMNLCCRALSAGTIRNGCIAPLNTKTPMEVLKMAETQAYRYVDNSQELPTSSPWRACSHNPKYCIDELPIILSYTSPTALTSWKGGSINFQTLFVISWRLCEVIILSSFLKRDYHTSYLVTTLSSLFLLFLP